jgi:hypothetical protein
MTSSGQRVPTGHETRKWINGYSIRNNIFRKGEELQKIIMQTYIDGPTTTIAEMRVHQGGGIPPPSPPPKWAQSKFKI